MGTPDDVSTAPREIDKSLFFYPRATTAPGGGGARVDMPRKGQHRGRQDWLDYSDDDEDDAPGPSSAGRRGGGGASEGSSKHGRRRVHGVDRAHHARLHADVGVDRGALQGSPRARAFAIADGTGRGGVVVGARGTVDDANDPRIVPLDHLQMPAALVDMFGTSVPVEALQDAYVQCGRSLSRTVDALLALTLDDHDKPGPAPPESHTGVDLWDTLPSEVRLLILDRLGPKDAARAASTCRDFAETVRAWRLNARGLHLPPDLSVAGLASLAGAYPLITYLSLRKTRGVVRDPADVRRILVGAAAGPAVCTITSVDLEGLDAAVADKDLPGVLDCGLDAVTELNVGRCARVTDKGVFALAQHRRGGDLRGLSLAGCSPGVTADGLEALLRGKSGGFPEMRRVDVSGCMGIRGSVTVPPRTVATSLRMLNVASLTELHAKLTADAPLENLSVSQCGTLRVLCVSAPRLERVNASMCKSLRRLELRCERLDSAVLQHCAELTDVREFRCPSLASELNVTGCKSLTTTTLTSMLRETPRLRALRAEGCVALEGELAASNRCLEVVQMDGCSRIGGVRLAAPVRTLVAKNCKALAAVWIEDPPPPEEDVEEEGRGGEGGEERWKNQSIRVDLRNCSSLERLVGVRAAATEGRLTVDLRGCTSLPPSARPPMHR